MRTERVLLVILDSLGVGELPDAALYGDEGANTLGNLAVAVGGLHLPNLGRLGLGNIIDVQGTPPSPAPMAAFGRMAAQSSGKDTTTGHWEIAGLILEKPFPLYPNGFPQEVIQAFEKAIGRQVLGNKAASGTEIIQELGAEHLNTGFPIIYTSADSVFQIAAHEEIIPIDQLYAMCKTARELLTGPHGVARIIARPFLGQPGDFVRTPRRKDYSLKPPGKTVLNLLTEHHLEVIAVGKIKDIFAGEGISRAIASENNMEGVDRIVELLGTPYRGLVFVNLVDFDMLYGHRNDPTGYANALTEFDARLPEVLAAMKEGDAAIFTADHGCDPTTPGTDHTREYVPVLVYVKGAHGGTALGARKTFADVGATIGEIFGLNWDTGKSFWQEVR